jgi:hypothetical protein
MSQEPAASSDQKEQKRQFLEVQAQHNAAVAGPVESATVSMQSDHCIRSKVIEFLASHDVNGVLDQDEKDNWCMERTLPSWYGLPETVGLRPCKPDWYGSYCKLCMRKTPQKWTRADHFGQCGQSCGCCRASCYMCNARARVAMVSTEWNRSVVSLAAVADAV